jgi:hypothetical protein
MASKRYVSAFDDESIDEPVYDDEAPCVFESDSEESDIEYERDCASPEPEDPDVMRVKRLEELKCKYEKPLAECYEAIKDKLTWKTVFNPKRKPLSTPRVADAPRVESPKARPTPRFGKPQPMMLDYRADALVSNGFVFKQPEIEQPFETQKYDKVCKFVSLGQKCPYADRCKFSHKQMRRDEAAPEQRTKKIWMCKNLQSDKTCRYGDMCMYAHTHAEVEGAVKDCTHGQSCRSVKKEGLAYVNVGPRKCVRRHPRERIADFITRTQ